MADIGHIFVPYMGGTKNEEEEIVYSEKDKNDTNAAVEGYLKEWQEGEKTLASLEALSEKLIKDKKATTGGLLENLNPASGFDEKIMTWALDAKRTPGETTIIEADDGFYLLYYSAKSKLNYRHYMIDNDMRAEDYNKWYEESLKTVTVTKGDTSRIDKDIVLSSGS